MLTVYWYAVGEVEETDKRTTSNKEHYTMSITRADFDGVVAALGFPSEKERKVIESKVAQVAEACDLTWHILPFIVALYGCMMELYEATGRDKDQILTVDFIAWLGKHEHNQGFAMEKVFHGPLHRHQPVGENFYVECETVYRVSNDADVAIGYVRINEEKFYSTMEKGVVECVYLYINAL